MRLEVVPRIESLISANSAEIVLERGIAKLVELGVLVRNEGGENYELSIYEWQMP